MSRYIFPNFHCRVKLITAVYLKCLEANVKCVEYIVVERYFKFQITPPSNHPCQIKKNLTCYGPPLQPS